MLILVAAGIHDRDRCAREPQEKPLTPAHFAHAPVPPTFSKVLSEILDLLETAANERSNP
jgi:hypothetical protein